MYKSKYLFIYTNNFMIQSDFHLHTCFSGDSKSSIPSMIESAIKKGLTTICITDHQDFLYQSPETDSTISFDLDIEQYFSTLKHYQRQYHSQIELLIGVELGLKQGIQTKLQNLIKNYNFDFIIGSSHEVSGLDPYYPTYYKTLGEKTGLTKYFLSIIENIQIFHDFQVYGHLDYAARYLPNSSSYKASDYFDILDEAMKTLIQMGKGIECNTSGLKSSFGHTNPHFDILKRYHELGGEILTIGSDAHKPEHIAYGFEQISEMLQAAGFRYYTVFREKRPEFIAL